MNRRRSWRVVVAVALLAAAMPVAGKGPVMAETVILTEADQGRTVDLHTGQSVTVDLPENATTGYRWAIDRADPGLVSVQEGPARSATSGAIGSGGRRSFVITASAPGTTEVVLKRWRSWEGEGGVAERYRVALRIGG
ncbi:MAG: protease inhibitor I42 family protein [Proteobacteria bacterium]|nr:protease inhibitor I42 family protein [Pseudomonadota bacterium]